MEYYAAIEEAHVRFGLALSPDQGVSRSKVLVGKAKQRRQSSIEYSQS